MGNFLVLGIWGEDVFFKYSLFTFFVSIACNSWGLYTLVPKEQNASLLSNLKTGLLKPPIIALALGMALGLMNAKEFMPEFVMNTFNNLGKCQGPVAMLLAGFVIGGYNLRELLLNGKVYIISLLRLIVLPAIMMLALMLLGVHEDVVLFTLIAFGTSIGLNTIVYPAAFGGETKTGAAMAMISHTLSVITIPLMYLVFIELL